MDSDEIFLGIARDLREAMREGRTAESVTGGFTLGMWNRVAAGLSDAIADEDRYQTLEAALSEEILDLVGEDDAELDPEWLDRIRAGGVPALVPDELVRLMCNSVWIAELRDAYVSRPFPAARVPAMKLAGRPEPVNAQPAPMRLREESVDEEAPSAETATMGGETFLQNAGETLAEGAADQMVASYAERAVERAVCRLLTDKERKQEFQPGLAARDGAARRRLARAAMGELWGVDIFPPSDARRHYRAAARMIRGILTGWAEAQTGDNPPSELGWIEWANSRSFVFPRMDEAVDCDWAAVNRDVEQVAASDPNACEVIELHLYAGMSLEYIAWMLNSTLMQVESQYQQVANRLPSATVNA